MVDCHPEETLSTEAEPRSTMLSEGWWSTMSSRKECNIYFIMPNVPFSFTTSSMCNEISLCIGQHFTWMLPVAMTSGNILLEFFPLLRSCTECRDVRHLFLDLNRTRIFFHAVNIFLNVTPLYISLVKNCVTFKIFKQSTDQWNYRKFTWGIIIKKCRPFNWPIRSQETNMRYN